MIDLLLLAAILMVCAMCYTLRYYFLKYGHITADRLELLSQRLQELDILVHRLTIKYDKVGPSPWDVTHAPITSEAACEKIKAGLEKRKMTSNAKIKAGLESRAATKRSIDY